MRTRRSIQGCRWQPSFARVGARAQARRSRLLSGSAFFASCIALCFACLSFAERLEKPTVARWDQADANALMSCAEEPSSSNEPLWCANPDSPHCTRGTPAPQSGEAWVGPMFAACEAPLTIPLALRPRAHGARNAGELLSYAHADGERLERPPKRA